MSNVVTIDKNKQWKTIGLHVIAWLTVFSLPYLLRMHDNRWREDPRSIQFFYLNNLTSINWVIIFYVNAYILTPRFLYTKKYAPLVSILLGMFAIAVTVHHVLFKMIITEHKPSLSGAIAFNLPAFLIAVAASLAYRMIIDKTKNDLLLHAKQEENLKSELSFLRSQISPHFMFNVLNNMLSMARAKSEQLEPTIIRLSSLMRYILYESDEDKVLVYKETEYLQSYIELQRQRLNSKVKLEVNINTRDDGREIAPMLLIPFIENAFKHGLGHIERPEIYIDLYMKNDLLYFTTRNKFNPASQEIKDKTSGIGLANVKRRLNLLYPERHNLLITDNDNWFTVSLQINLSDHVAMHSSR